MRLVCPERDELWRDFDAALNEYLAQMSAMVAKPANREVASAAWEARTILDEIRWKIHNHCEQHGCEPTFNAKRAGAA